MNKTNVCIVLDRSGSMQAVRTDALGAVNSYIDAAKKDRSLYESRFSLITFNSESVDTIRENEIMETVKPVASEEYRCGGWTPLYDAIGRGIGILEVAGGDKAILVIMTDGQENASREFSHGRIKDLIDAKQKAGWMVTFLGEGLGVAKQGADIGTRSAGVASYASLNMAGAVLASSNARYASTESLVEQMEIAEQGLSEEERELLNKTDKK